MTQEVDKALIERWQRGDIAAFEDLVRRWQQRIGRFFTHYVGDADTIDDLCQEVFLRVYLAGRRYRHSGAFSTWIYHIALNVARDHARRGQRATMQSWQDYDPVDAGADTLHVCEQRELGDDMADALADLPEPLRLVVVLRHFEKVSFADMARLLKLPASTLKSRFQTALKQLRTHLQQRGWGLKETDA